MSANDTPLLPEALRASPFGWGAWPSDENAELLALARGVLEAALPSAPLAVPEPPFLGHADEKFYADDEEVPDWVLVWPVLYDHVDGVHVTAGQMAAAEAECARRGLDTTDFQEVWVRRITGWIVEKALEWCGLMVDDLDSLTPWFPELAEQYALRGLAAEQAVSALRGTVDLPASRAALTRLAADTSLPDDIRELAAYPLGR
ncbi:hypothetical protein AB0C77_16645 [Streptomyces sp. NPDC048629]|uniref:hypothetical protein n=1 Tax=Streptomyces sp. NPDC048629 TaxID=3154824 RepID=UPI00341FE182